MSSTVIKYLRQGTTPNFIFTIPTSINLITAKARLVFYQKGRQLIIKENSDLTIIDDTISYKMTQEETYFFIPKVDVTFMFRFVTTDNNVYSSNEFTIQFLDNKDTKVISYD